MTPDYPFREVFWPQFIKKRPHYAENRPFQPPIACLATIPRPEKAIFSNDAGQFPGDKVLGHVSGKSRRKRQGSGPGDLSSEMGDEGPAGNRGIIGCHKRLEKNVPQENSRTMVRS